MSHLYLHVIETLHILTLFLSCKKITEDLYEDLGVRKDNIKMGLKQVGWKNIAWSDLAEE